MLLLLVFDWWVLIDVLGLRSAVLRAAILGSLLLLPLPDGRRSLDIVGVRAGRDDSSGVAAAIGAGRLDGGHTATVSSGVMSP